MKTPSSSAFHRAEISSRRPIVIALVLSVSAALFLASAVKAATITVTTSADGGAGSLRQAIVSAGAGDTIDFAAGLTDVVLTSGELPINKSLTINGSGANLLSVRRSSAAGTPSFRIFNVSGASTVALFGLTITNGSDPNGGGGISNSGGGTLTLGYCTVAGNSSGAGGGGILNGAGSAVTVNNCTISENSAAFGAGVFNGNSMTIINSTLSGNTTSATGGGGGISTIGGLTLLSTTISDNAANVGGGIYNSTAAGKVTARNTIIALNTAPTGPDVRNDTNSQGFTSEGHNLIGNLGSNSGLNITPGQGDQFGVSAAQLNLGPLQDNGGPTTTHALLSGSVAIEAGESGGVGTDQRGFARPVDSPAVANAPGGDGSDIGAYEVQADLLPGCSGINRIVKNNNDSGTESLREVIANVCAGSTITFAPEVTGTIDLTSGQLVITKGLTISGPGAKILTVRRSSVAGTPPFRIFGIGAGSSSIAISDLTIANGNTAANPNMPDRQSGAGIANFGVLTLNRVAVADNVGNDGANGGGIFNTNGTLTINDSTISGNTVSTQVAVGTGGGVASFGGTLTVRNSTISGNSALGPGTGDLGGGVISYGSVVTLFNSTVSGNSADQGGGIFVINGGSVTSRNTIVALNTSPSGPDVNGPLNSHGFNLIGNTSGATISPAQFSDQLGVTAAQLNLGPLQDNGGPTLTHALLAGSTAVDRGDSSGSSTDQRGFTRPVDLSGVPNAQGGDGSDIGAFEFSGTPPTPTQVVSRKSHGMLGPFGINLPLTGNSGIECRTGGANGDHQVVVSFAASVTLGSATVSSGIGSVLNASASGNQITVNLTSVANAQKITVTLFGVSDGSNTGNLNIPMSVLLGDTSGNGSVNATDVSQTKSKSGQAVNATNFRTDVTVSASINSTDVSTVKSKSGTALP